MANWIPGRDTLGRGFNPLEDTFSPSRTPIFRFDTVRESREINGVAFDIPEGVNINSEQSSAIYTNIVKHSTVEMEEHIAAEAHVKGKYGLFGGQVDAYYDHSTKRSSEYDLSLREFGMRLWELGMDFNATPRPEVIEAIKTFAAEAKPDSGKVDRFFSTFGTHYVSAVAVGGRCSMCSSVSKSLKATEEEIKAQVELEYGAYINASGGVDRSKMKKEYVENRQVKISVFGGNVALAGKFQYGDGHYSEWLDSVNREPDVVKQTLQEIWNLPGLNADEIANLKWAFDEYCVRKSRYTLSMPQGAVAGVTATGRAPLDPRPSQSITVEMWLRPSHDGGSEETLCQIDPLLLLRRKRSTPVYNNYGAFHGDNRADGKNAPLKPGKWAHLAVTVGASQHGDQKHNIIDFYFMGIRAHQGKTRMTAHDWRQISRIWIGTRNLIDPEFVFPGEIQEFRVWGRRRYEAQIRENMFRRLTGKEQDLVVYLPLIDGGTSRHTAERTGKDITANLVGDARWARAEQPFELSLESLRNQPELLAAAPSVPKDEAATWIKTDLVVQ
ncbi:MAG: MAC/perforin domain-containing protein [Pseudomonadota bacterium]